MHRSVPAMYKSIKGTAHPWCPYVSGNECNTSLREEVKSSEIWGDLRFEPLLQWKSPAEVQVPDQNAFWAQSFGDLIGMLCSEETQG